MQRKRITNYQYINYLVNEIQQKAAAGLDSEEAFTDLCAIYEPLLRNNVKLIVKNPNNRLPANDVYFIILGIFYRLILRYDGKFSNTENNVKNYTGVYFSSYLKQTLSWELYRLRHPNKRETDNLEKDLPYMEISTLVRTNSRRLVCFDTPKGITPDFINMCLKIKNGLKSDLHADIMFLLYGYDAKTKELAKIFKVSATKIGKLINEIHEFWIKPENGLVPEV